MVVCLVIRCQGDGMIMHAFGLRVARAFDEPLGL